MTSRRFPWTEVFVLAIAAAIVVYMAYAGYRRQLAAAPRYDTLSSFDAHSGGYRAWYELLQREGVHVERFEQRPAFLDPSIGTLISAPNFLEFQMRANENGNVTGMPQEVDFENLQAWVKNGGRLIWVTDGSWDSDLDVPHDANAGPQNNAAVSVAATQETAGVSAVSGTSKMRLPFDRSPSYAPLVADGGGSVVAQRRLGKGSIIVVTDQSLFTNKRLPLADNARLAYNLASGGNHGAVAFDEYVHGHLNGASFWAILPGPVRLGVIVVLSGLLLLGLGTAMRFGPTARLPDTAERTSAEYLSSMAQLMANGRAARKALRDLVTVTLHEVAAGLGLSERATLAEIVARIGFGEDGEARAAELDELGRLRALDRPTGKDLLRAAQLCAALRKEYSRYGRIGFGRRAAPIRRTA